MAARRRDGDPALFLIGERPDPAEEPKPSSLRTAGDVMPRYKIGPLMVVILYVAIGLAALSSPRSSLSDQIWASTIYTVTAFFMTAGTLMAFVRRGRERTVWTGFAVFGWPYLLLLGFQAWSVTPRTPLVTTWISRELLESARDFLGLSFYFRNESAFSAVCHSFFTMLSGWVGARLACSFSAEESQDQGN
jgi:hypothetical protein